MTSCANWRPVICAGDRDQILCKPPLWSMEHRAQFFGLAAKIMRDILVDHARKRLATKRGGEQLQISLTAAERFGSKPEVELIALNDALNQLATTNPQHSRVVELRFFGGLTIEAIGR